jgi:hypothetical protein
LAQSLTNKVEETPHRRLSAWAVAYGQEAHIMVLLDTLVKTLSKNISMTKNHTNKTGTPFIRQHKAGGFQAMEIIKYLVGTNDDLDKILPISPNELRRPILPL